jgi:hypothetical protein
MTIFAPPPMNPLPQSVEWWLVRDKSMESRNGREGWTLGEIRYGFFDSARVCHSVEDEDRHLENGNGNPHKSAAMPLGRYRLTIHQSPHHGHVCIGVNAVPGFSGVEVNANGTAERLLGNVAVGDERMLDGVRNCQLALTRLVTELRRQTMKGVAVYLNVVRAE